MVPVNTSGCPVDSFDASHTDGCWQAHVVDDCRLCIQQEAQRHQPVLHQSTLQQPHLALLKAHVSLLGWLTGTTPLLTAICSPIGRSLLLLNVKISSPATAAGLALKGVGPFETPACSVAASAITEALLLIEATTLLPLRAPGAIAILGRLLVLLHIPCRGLPLLLRGGPALWLGRQGRLGQQLRLVFSSHGHRASTSISRGCRVHCLSQ